MGRGHVSYVMHQMTAQLDSAGAQSESARHGGMVQGRRYMAAGANPFGLLYVNICLPLYSWRRLSLTDPVVFWRTPSIRAAPNPCRRRALGRLRKLATSAPHRFFQCGLHEVGARARPGTSDDLQPSCIPITRWSRPWPLPKGRYPDALRAQRRPHSSSASSSA